MYSPNHNHLAHLKIPLENIISATNNFDVRRSIYNSEYEKRYSGKLLWSGELIRIRARRWLNEKMDDEKEQQFWMEISLLSSLKHKNLVSLVGFCDENDEKIIIIKLETRSSLDNYLSDSVSLPWVRRLEISVGIANALSYIYHDETRDFSIIHRNIDSEIVLLNDNWEAKLSGFEFSMKVTASERHQSFHTDKVSNMLGYYTDPTYLETKRGNMSRKQSWKEVVDKVLSHLSRWKMNLLSIGGRFTLLKSVLGSMPIFHMSIFKVHSSILKSLKSIHSRFFNGQDPKSSKTSWVKRIMVLTPKDKGGLGVSSLYALNRGLMIKWVWRFYFQKNSLWTKVIKAIYGEDDNLNKVSSGSVRTCWSVQEVRAFQGCGINVTDFIRLKLGNEDNTRFWIDNWYEGGVIKDLFPRMFAIETNKNASVSLKLNAPNLDNSFRRQARSGIEEQNQVSFVELHLFNNIRHFLRPPVKQKVVFHALKFATPIRKLGNREHGNRTARRMLD
nr:protein kinase-like domain-containing protein [Tanacetum cinerariifolium]